MSDSTYSPISSLFSTATAQYRHRAILLRICDVLGSKAIHRSTWSKVQQQGGVPLRPRPPGRFASFGARICMPSMLFTDGLDRDALNWVREGRDCGGAAQPRQNGRAPGRARRGRRRLSMQPPEKFRNGDLPRATVSASALHTCASSVSDMDESSDTEEVEVCNGRMVYLMLPVHHQYMITVRKIHQLHTVIPGLAQQ